MKDEFEKNDEWMMNAARFQRESKVPQKELDAFHEGVMKEIAARGMRTPGMPSFALALATGVSLAVIVGVVLYLHLPAPQKQEVPVTLEVKSVRTEPQNIPSGEVQHAPVSIPAQPAVQASAKPASLPAVSNDEDIIEEIEALKELGAWTDDDEQEAGIPVEVTYGDLEVGINSSASQSPVSVARPVQS